MIADLPIDFAMSPFDGSIQPLINDSIDCHISRSSIIDAA
jgi:hypothetical protein